MFLLLVKIVFALFGTVADVQEHGRVPQNHQKGQPPVQEEQQNQGSHYLDKTLDNHGEAVVEGVGDGVHIVSEAAHNVSVGVGVKIFQRQAFHGAEQIPADIVDDLLGGPGHGLGVAQGGKGAGTVNSG